MKMHDDQSEYVDPAVIKMVLDEADNNLQSWRDLILEIDRKCLQFMGYLLTAGIALAATAGSLMLAGGKPAYAVVIPALGSAYMLYGFRMGIKVISGDIPILGSQPKHWFEPLSKKATFRAAAGAKLRMMQKNIERAAIQSEESARMFNALKKVAMRSTISIIGAATIMFTLDAFRGVPPLDLFAELPRISSQAHN